ncbi:unnamed protein product [Staurois parvus]|uniref:Uncharacterized protein n=1 Tax=Staurois parvus TaxID=386267 RepID=A0ABN9ALX3_9NEOB|nr:unnamed protein product [Staurois parvus]
MIGVLLCPLDTVGTRLQCCILPGSARNASRGVGRPCTAPVWPFIYMGQTGSG